MTTVREVRDEQTVTRSGEPLPAPIDGVMVERLRMHADHRGRLMPCYDPAHPFWADGPIVWAYNFTVRPGHIKGWGMHKRQVDRYLVLHADMRAVLYDAREDSPTFGRIHEVHFTRATPGLLRIPTGVWHADQNWGDFEAIAVNFPTAAYDAEEPDKFRIDPHSGEIPFDFTLRDY
jgi:dTDP-4-dehydrorhamnose 3,5-epimerase